jgi:hypothetical protein
MLAFWEETLRYVHADPVEAGWVILPDRRAADPIFRWTKLRIDARAKEADCTSQVPLET